MTVRVFRIARETAKYKASDMSGAGAAASGGRWNTPKVPMVYAAENRALAALETWAHVAEPDGLLLDRYLIEIAIPDAIWEKRTLFDPAANPAWDAIPESATAIAWGNGWASAASSLIACVPSVIVPEEHSILINPTHPDANKVTTTILRKWLYDPRLSK